MHCLEFGALTGNLEISRRTEQRAKNVGIKNKYIKNKKEKTFKVINLLREIWPTLFCS